MVNKKGIMLKFLTTILLAIVIFAPACMVSSKFFRLSAQANDNFAEFVEKIDKLGNYGQQGEQSSFVLIKDKNTCIANLWSGSDYHERYTRCSSGQVEETWLGVGKSCQGKDCICLIKELSVTETDRKSSNCGSEKRVNEITPTKIACISVPDNYYIYGLSWRDWCRFGDDSRRTTMSMVKEGNKVYVCEAGNCDIPETPEKHLYKG